MLLHTHRMRIFLDGPEREREREIYFKSHISLWEHSSHIRLIGRGVPSVSVVSQLLYKFLCLASPEIRLIDLGVTWQNGFRVQLECLAITWVGSGTFLLFTLAFLSVNYSVLRSHNLPPIGPTCQVCCVCGAVWLSAIFGIYHQGISTQEGGGKGSSRIPERAWMCVQNVRAL